MEDLDTPRSVAGAADDILRTLAVFGLHSDEPVIYQSQRTAAYEAALRQLQNNGVVYPCCCTRKEIADSAIHGIEGLVYPGTCRDGMAHQRSTPAWRVRTDHLCRHSRAGGNPVIQNAFCSTPLDSRLRGNDETPNVVGEIEFDDALQGHISQQLEREIGDFVVKRADGLFAYQLAVVVDDAAQGITHVVRGADLLNSTPRQIHLQRLLELSTPAYMHLPVVVNEAGEKLSKQTLAAPVDVSQPVSTLLRVLDFLKQQPPAELSDSDVSTLLAWAVRNWDAEKIQGIKTLSYAGMTNSTSPPACGA
jgi:glutamyl-Q tRNA(Asp) synthetase